MVVRCSQQHYKCLRVRIVASQEQVFHLERMNVFKLGHCQKEPPNFGNFDDGANKQGYFIYLLRNAGNLLAATLQSLLAILICRRRNFGFDDFSTRRTIRFTLILWVAFTEPDLSILHSMPHKKPH